MLEKAIENKVVAYAKEKGFLVYKFTSPNNRSVPDRIFISPTGAVSFIEFKQKGKVPTKLQAHTIQALLDRGVSVKVVDEVVTGKAVIDEWI